MEAAAESLRELDVAITNREKVETQEAALTSAMSEATQQ
jgi:hypothetical protein